jgi:hypothetical protein
MEAVVAIMIVVEMLGHPRYRVRESAMRNIVGNTAEWIAARHRDPEVRRRGELVRERRIANAIERCAPRDYPCWPCIDFLAAHYLQWLPPFSDHRIGLGWAITNVYMKIAENRTDNPEKNFRYRSEYGIWRCATARWVEDMVRSGQDERAISATIAAMVRRERAWLRERREMWPPPICVGTADRIGVIGLWVGMP